MAQMLCAFWIGGMDLVLGGPSGGLSAPLVRISLAMMGWQVLCALLLVGPLLGGNPTGWAGVESLLFCSLLAEVAGLAARFTHPSPLQVGAPDQQTILTTLFRFAVELTLGVGLYRARAWYGIGEREAWRVMWRRGWWVLVVTAALTLAQLTAFTTQNR